MKFHHSNNSFPFVSSSLTKTTKPLNKLHIFHSFYSPFKKSFNGFLQKWERRNGGSWGKQHARKIQKVSEFFRTRDEMESTFSYVDGKISKSEEISFLLLLCWFSFAAILEVIELREMEKKFANENSHMLIQIVMRFTLIDLVGEDINMRGKQLRLENKNRCYNIFELE